MSPELAEFLNKVLEISPYLLLLIAITIAYVVIFQSTIKNYKELVETTIKTLKEGNDTVISALKDAYKDVKGGR